MQTGNRLVRLERHQGEYWLFSLMLVSYKKLFSQAVPQPHVKRNLSGFCADHLMRNAVHLPPNVLAPERTRRIYFNGVLARAKMQSKYKPSRQLWLRKRNGFYTFNPDLQMRAHHTGDWIPWKQWLNEPLVFGGCSITTTQVVARLDAASEQGSQLPSVKRTASAASVTNNTGIVSTKPTLK